MKCPSCGAENSEDAPYCNLCQTSFLKTTADDALFLTDAGPSSPNSRQNWFQRHLNWTWVLAQAAVFCLVIAWILVFVLFFKRTDGTDAGSLGTAIAAALMSWNFAWLLSMLAPFIAGAWVLSKKSRSYAWLLILLVPFGLIFFLLLGKGKQLKLPETVSPKPAPARSGMQSSSRYSF